MKHRLATRVLALVLVVSLQALFIPASAGGDTASLAGMVISSETDAPLTGVRLHAGDPKTGRVFTTRPTPVDGSFNLEELPAASYRLAVEVEGGLYVVDSPLKLSPGQAQSVTVAINPQSAPSPEQEQEKKKKKGAGFWENPVTASAVVIGVATVVGLLIKEGTDDDEDASPSSL
jgi:hypothetical protein